MIGFYVHHHGSGHLARARRIAAATTDAVVGFSTSPAPGDWPGAWVRLPDDAVDPAPGDDPTAGGVLHWAPTGSHPYGERMRLLAEGLWAHGVSVLVVDVSVEVTLAARLLGIPVVVMAMRGDRTDPAHRAAYSVARSIVAPWPEALSEPGLPSADRIVHVGGISRFDAACAEDGAAPLDAVAHNRSVFVLWGAGGGVWSEDDRARAQASTPGWTWTFGAPEAEVAAHMARADVVVAHAGQNAVAEVAALRRPAVVVGLDRPHDEQLATVRALRRGDLAETVELGSGRPGDLDWPTLLDSASARDGRAWRAWSDGHGAHRAARAIEAAAAGKDVAWGTALVSIVHGRHAHLRRLLQGVADGDTRPERIVVVAMGDAAIRRVCAEATAATGLVVDVVDLPPTDHLPLARARNVGVRRAAELGCGRLILLDVDCIPGRGLVGRYHAALTSPGSVLRAASADAGGPVPTFWSGPVTYLPPAPAGGYTDDDLVPNPHPARPAPAPGEVLPAEDLRLFWSLSFATTVADYDTVGGFCEEYVGYGGEDTDLAMRLDAAGGRLFWLGGAEAFHQYHPTQSPPVAHLHDILRNVEVFSRRWGFAPMEGWLEAFEAAGLVTHDPTTGAWTATEAADA